MATTRQSIYSYSFPLLIVSAMILGTFAGCLLGDKTEYLKPLGDLFLNLLLTAIVPVIFFSVSSAIARSASLGKLTHLSFYTSVVFIMTNIIVSILTICVVKLFPLASNLSLPIAANSNISAQIHISTILNQMVNILTVREFLNLFSPQHLLALIVFASFIGFAAAKINNHGKRVIIFLKAGEEISMRVCSMMMYYAPIGFFAYFAVLTAQLGPKLVENYLYIALLYYSFSIFYFIAIYTLYAYLSGRVTGVKLFWKNIFLPLLSAFATSSSAASIPANLAATKAMRVPKDIYELVIPLGTMIHKDGSVIGAIIKIGFLFGIFHLHFTSFSVLLTAVIVSLLVGTIMAAIPSGGMLGELLILNIYGFPQSALMMIAAISIIIDPMATMLNVTGNTVSSMLIARLVEGAKWFSSAIKTHYEKIDETLSIVDRN